MHNASPIKLFKGDFMKNLLVKGNKKLHKSIFCWSITPVLSCLNSSSCAKTCYAHKYYIMYPFVKPAWDHNFEMAKDGSFVEPIIGQLKRARICSAVRIHVAGDFFSQEYIENWKRIAVSFPEIVFYSYSKVFDILDLTPLTSLHNVNIINSVAFDGGVNFGDKDRIALLTGADYFVCPVVKGSKLVCGKDCSACLTQSKVCFHKH